MQCEFLRVHEIASSLGVGKGRAYQLIRAGMIPSVRVGGAIRIPRAAWESWIREKGKEAISSLSTGDRGS